MISTYSKDFSWKKNGPDSPKLDEFFFQIATSATSQF
jgi:hypothetical protein